MKKSFLILLLLVSSISFSQGQRGGVGGGRQQQNQNRQGGEREIKEFSASDAAGIFYYDTKKVIKKIKVKDKGLINTVKKALMNYNFKVKEIAFINSEKFKDLDVLMKSMRGNQRGRPNRNDNNNSNINNSIDNNPSNKEGGLRQKVGKVIRPVRNEIRENEEELNNVLENVLSEKQHKKWLKYQEKIKKSLEPERPDRQNGRGFNSNRQSRQMRN